MRLHEAPCKLITKHSKIGGRGVSAVPHRKITDGNHLNHV